MQELVDEHGLKRSQVIHRLHCIPQERMTYSATRCNVAFTLGSLSCHSPPGTNATIRHQTLHVSSFSQYFIA